MNNLFGRIIRCLYVYKNVLIVVGCLVWLLLIESSSIVIFGMVGIVMLFCISALYNWYWGDKIVLENGCMRQFNIFSNDLGEVKAVEDEPNPMLETGADPILEGYEFQGFICSDSPEGAIRSYKGVALALFT